MLDLDEVITQAEGTFAIASGYDRRRVRRLADDLLDASTPDQIAPIGADPQRPLDLRLAAKLALSKQIVTDIDWHGRLAIVFAMWGEGRRLRPRSEDNPTGEDALAVKLDSLHWLLGDTSIDWRIYAVDDGDPDDSGTIAEMQAHQHTHGGRVRVLRLSDAIPTDSGPLAGLSHVDDSRKGGAIIHGAEVAMADGYDAVVITDADNSVDLGQVGLLLGPLAAGTDVIVGDRKHADSVLVKAEARWGPGIVVLRHMQRMVGHALFDQGLSDTQAAFKLYSRSVLDDILAAPSTYGFSFDSDWLYAAVGADRRIEKVPFAFIDSFEESASIAQGPMTTWESILRGLVAAARGRGVSHDQEMAKVIDDHANAAQLERVVQLIPPDLEGAPAARLGDPTLMSPQKLRSWLETLAAESGTD